MIKRLRKLNNQGSTLVMVIVVALLVGILAALVLSLTVRNFELSRLKKNTAKNFYGAENVIDEVRVQLERLADRASQDAYTAWLEQYSFMENSDERRELFYRVYEESLRKLIQEQFVDKVVAGDYGIFSEIAVPSGCSVRWNDSAVDHFALRDGRFQTDSEGNVVTDLYGNPIRDYDGDVVLDGVSITYTDESGFSTTITTNLDFKIQYPGFRVFSASSNNPAYQYIIISDKNISGKSVQANLNGSLYAAGEYDPATGANGIRFVDYGTKVNIVADTIVTRNSFSVDDSAQVSIVGKGREFNGTYLKYYSTLWANEIELKKSDTGGSSASSLDLIGRAYVADDLSLDSDNAKFSLTGEYYGYSVSDARAADATRNGTPSGSSAIIINGKNAKLDLSKASTWISGKAFITVPSSFGSKEISTFLEGESITYRGLQSAYLLPGECLADVGHNPVSLEEYKKYLESGDEFDVSKLKLDNYRNKTGIDLEYYVDFDHPIRTVFVNFRQNGATHTMIYFYLNFRNHNKAQQYFEKYYDVNHSLVDKRMTMFEDGSIILDEENLVNTGNVIAYNDNGLKRLEFTPGTFGYSDSEIVSKESELNTKYEAIMTTLDEKNSGTSLSYKVTDSIVKFNVITEDAQKEQKFTLPNGANYYLITGKDVNITSSKYSGSDGAIVLAKGNVTVTGGISFNGLIIAGGNVTLNGGTMTLTSKPEEVAQLIAQEKEVNKFFIGEEVFSGVDDGSVYASDLITVTYDNWKKN